MNKNEYSWPSLFSYSPFTVEWFTIVCLTTQLGEQDTHFSVDLITQFTPVY